ncbi:hypothetical protein HanXRQr2_Chr16g0766481 [Helianthus annuus]|uniref:Uncharacterized protein n=1 Tax=Helianthus annuus TaxID=4232 RepID=A0A251S617_HELAN|nr:hypothetical protein HanXRQr2_Chr16g0766481 [Helianthus annuus]
MSKYLQNPNPTYQLHPRLNLHRLSTHPKLRSTTIPHRLRRRDWWRPRRNRKRLDCELGRHVLRMAAVDFSGGDEDETDR